MAWDDYDDRFDELFDSDEDDDETGLIVEGKAKTNGPLGPVETEKAILWVTNDGKEHWIPKSQLISQNAGFIVITDWLADQKGWTSHINNVPHQPTEPEEFDLNDDIPF